jgi:hypothetical protein
MSKHLPIVTIRHLADGNIWLACGEKGIGILAGSRQQGIADMTIHVKEFTIRNIEDKAREAKSHVKN